MRGKISGKIMGKIMSSSFLMSSRLNQASFLMTFFSIAVGACSCTRRLEVWATINCCCMSVGVPFRIIGKRPCQTTGPKWTSCDSSPVSSQISRVAAVSISSPSSILPPTVNQNLGCVLPSMVPVEGSSAHINNSSWFWCSSKIRMQLCRGNGVFMSERFWFFRVLWYHRDDGLTMCGLWGWRYQT